MRNALCHAGGLSLGGGLCITPCVTGGGPVHNALCHGGARAQRLVLVGGPVHNALCHRGGLCTTPCVTGGPVHNALCHREGLCNALCERGGLCTTPCVTARAQRLVSRRGLPVHNALCRGGLCTTPCVTARRVHNALCYGGAQRLVSRQRRTPCVTGWVCTTPCVTGGLLHKRCVMEAGKGVYPAYGLLDHSCKASHPCAKKSTCSSHVKKIPHVL